MTTDDAYDVHALAETLALVENTLALLDEQIDRRTGDGPVVGPTPEATDNRNVRLAAARIARVHAAELRRRTSSLAEEVLEPTLRVLRSLVTDGVAAGALVRDRRRDRRGGDPRPHERRRACAPRWTPDWDREPRRSVRDGRRRAGPLDARAGVQRPDYRDQAAGAGVRAVLALPLRGNQQRPAGALVPVSGTLGALRPDVVDAGRSCAALAALALLTVQGAASATRAIATRDRIGQAKGLLMQQHGIDADEASDQLIRTSQGPNIKLVAVADEVVRAHLAREFAHRTA
ncbi:ANTAR domain-containing protein [Pseudonocardia dioxanivorans]|jgi:hypothetical protein|uniref:ANTAR domain-containing protein n=1 Tax=Pseudonocardia dioxanivorans TaxID=240495 RepID=UPI000CD168C1|nr:ANTAR domain-containing protein [Pseudonocardia dioxanivorans]